MIDVLRRRGDQNTDTHREEPVKTHRQRWLSTDQGQASLPGLRKNQPCLRLDFGLPASGTGRQDISVL